MKLIRLLTFGAFLFATVTVAVGYVPQFITPVNSEERVLFDLFTVSLIDDITHGMTGLAALIAVIHSARACVFFMTAFGWYYALDALFYSTYGFFNTRPLIDDLMLNLPHIGISAIMLGVVYWWAPRQKALA